MLLGEMAREQIADRIRAAEKERVARAVCGRRTDGTWVVARRVGSGVLAAVASFRAGALTAHGRRSTVV